MQLVFFFFFFFWFSDSARAAGRGGGVCIAGITQPKIAIILQKGNSLDDTKFTIVVPPEDYVDKLWNGTRINEDIARDYFCADEALASDKLPQVCL